MDLTLSELVADVRSNASAPLSRLRIAANTASDLAQLGDALVSEFVEECRRAGHGWAELAPCLSDHPRHASSSKADPAGSEGRRADDEPARTVKEHTGKYRPLWQWLTRQEQPEIDATFSELEEVLGFPLPPSCREHQPHWYGYDGSAVARAIIDAGWRARNVNVANESLTLTRNPGHLNGRDA
jgi:hypothetical protein